MAPRAGLPHLFVTRPPETQSYTAHSAGGGSKPPIPPRNRRQHGQSLSSEYRTAWKAALTRGQVSDVNTLPKGVALEFSSAPRFDLALNSLENEKHNIRLLAVRREGDTTHATVGIPLASEAHFLKRFDDYIEKDTRKGAPQHQPLVAPIEHIVLATLPSLWTDTVPLPTDPDRPQRWEVWLETEGENAGVVVERFRVAATRAGLELSPKHTLFVDRAVLLARGSARQLTASREAMSLVAEVRMAKESAEFFLEMPRAEEGDWVKDLVDRTTRPDKRAPSVCLLDTGVNRAHPLLEHALAVSDLHTYNAAWGVHDDGPDGPHGTRMAGLALYGDLTEVLASRQPLTLLHRLESSKILSAHERNPPDLYGAITKAGVARPEIVAPERRRVFCMAVTSIDDRDRGEPSSWSAEVDQICAGIEDGVEGRLMVISTGNCKPLTPSDYLTLNLTDEVHDPGQSWNALTVGAYTEKVVIAEQSHASWRPLAPPGHLCPTSTTSGTWKRTWPLKPELVMEGGNLAMDPSGTKLENLDSLRLLTTHHAPLTHLLGSSGDTSSAAALLARTAAQVWAQHPDLWAETVRALLVHSADWTPAMQKRFSGSTHSDIETRLRVFGYGVPCMERALWSAQNALTLVVQETLQPFETAKSKEMHLHALPWPKAALEALGATPVTLRVTLSYFVEPNPARRGWTNRHRYASHGLRFEMQAPTESLKQFQARVNSEADDGDRGSRRGDSWDLGSALRSRGSIHSDRWHGTAVDLSARAHLAVFPALGWWRERPKLGRTERRVRYALVVSIETPPGTTDIYTPVANSVGVRPISVGIPISSG